MCILQIGELVGRLTNAFKANHSEIPWHKIRGMRNYVAHKYGSIDFEIVWFASTKSIPDLRSFCEFFLSEWDKLRKHAMKKALRPFLHLCAVGYADDVDQILFERIV